MFCFLDQIRAHMVIAARSPFSWSDAFSFVRCKKKTAYGQIKKYIHVPYDSFSCVKILASKWILFVEIVSIPFQIRI